MEVVSGGQTGVDRAALDAALERRLPCGGWCPAGRAAEDGPIAAHYPLRETPSADPTQRTDWNVRDSDATLILSAEPLSGGTARTREACERLQRPFHVVDPFAADPRQVRQWLVAVRPARLNVAGPRESESPGTYEAALRILREALAGHLPSGPPSQVWERG